jgi:hypothetical protein
MSIIVPIKRGKPAWPKMRKPPSAEAIRKSEAKELISALAAAARDIGTNGIVEDYSRQDFHLYPPHIAQLLSPDHPDHAFYSAMKKESRNRIAVPWPWRQDNEEKTTNELRERPFEIIGLLMRKMLDGDSTFFNEVAEALIKAKTEANRKGSKANSRGKNHVGKIAADMPSYGMMGDPNWFTRIEKPARNNKAPMEIWKLCKQRYDREQEPPNRREIRDHLKAKGIPDTGLRTVLSRLNLTHLEEGPRPPKT